MPEAIDYSAGELRLKGIALQPDELASLSLRLKARGYVALTDAAGLVIRSERLFPRVTAVAADAGVKKPVPDRFFYA